MATKTKFQATWIDPILHKSWSTWLTPCVNSFEAKCIVCQKIIKLSNMGIKAIKSHETSKKHQTLLKCRENVRPLSYFTNQQTPSTSHELVPVEAMKLTENISNSHLNVNEKVICTNQVLTTVDSNEATTSKTEYSLNKFFERDETTSSEILWCLAVVKYHLSARSAAECVNLFPLLFKDSTVARNFKLHRTKISYLICYGLAPYFKNELKQYIINSNLLYIISFDESFNKIAQKEQMDVNIRFWDMEKNQVQTRYLGSSFLGHTTAVDLLGGLKQVLNGFNLQSLVQISMDGPNVNFKLLRDLKNELYLENPESPKILELGSCGIHTIHNSFKCGMAKTNWEIIKFLRPIYNLFKNVPARRADFIRYTSSDVFPLKFCAVRWVENLRVAERALKLLPNLKKYVSTAKLHKNVPTSGSYKIVEKMLEDELLAAKLSFFQVFAGDLQAFLTKFQTEKPLAPLLYDTLHDLIRNIMSRFIKTAVLNSNKTVAGLLKIQVCDVNNRKPFHELELGIATKLSLRNLKCNNTVIMLFKKECMDCLTEFCIKMMKKSPLANSLVRGISCLNPVVILEKSVAKKRMEIAMECLVSCNRISIVQADKLAKEFDDLISNKSVIKEIKEYTRGMSHYDTDRLDKLYYNICVNYNCSEDLKNFIKIVMILSHGNANIERGFSINKECLVENLIEKTLVSHRIVYDAIEFHGGIERIINISKKMIHYARNSNGRYKEALRKQAAKIEIEGGEQTGKRQAKLQIKELEEKRRRISQEYNNIKNIIDAEISNVKKNV